MSPLEQILDAIAKVNDRIDDLIEAQKRANMTPDELENEELKAREERAWLRDRIAQAKREQAQRDGELL